MTARSTAARAELLELPGTVYRARQAAGLTQYELAAKINLTQPVISYVERSRLDMISLRTALALLRWLEDAPGDEE